VFNAKQRRIDTLLDTLDERDETIRDLNADVERLTGVVAQRDTTIEELRDTVANKLAEIRDLNAENGRLSTENGRLVRELTEASERLTYALGVFYNAKHGLTDIFGDVTYMGTRDGNTVMVFLSEDTLSNITLTPRSGELVVTDPKNVVKDVVRVTITPAGELDEYEQREIEAHRAKVNWVRQTCSRTISGSVSLAADRGDELDELETAATRG
jgi:polyhydroxyalkanoate synthesis regulator phasin